MVLLLMTAGSETRARDSEALETPEQVNAESGTACNNKKPRRFQPPGFSLNKVSSLIEIEQIQQEMQR